MKNFLLILLGKGTIKAPTDDIFKSECYYDWIKLKNIPGGTGKSPEDLLAACYDEEISERQKVITNGMHVQQGIIAIPTDDDGEDENAYNAFLDRITDTSIIFISFISIPAWSEAERKKIFGIIGKNANKQVKKEILSKIDKTRMRLFYTFDHNDLAVICDGKKTKLEDYLNVLAEIRAIVFEAKNQDDDNEQEAEKYQAVHDITTIYGYKDPVDSQDKINAVISISGQDVVFENDIENLKSFAIETIGRYDHLSEYKDITWDQLTSMSSILHSKNVITSRVHIGCGKLEQAHDDYSKISSSLFNNFKSCYESKINAINFDKLAQLYNGDTKYIASIKIMLYEIGFAIDTTLRRGFSKYNGVCYIESYLCFLDYIKGKTVEKYCNLAKLCGETKNDEKKVEINADIEELAETLVDISNSFYKSILTLDSSIMHSERRFIMSDPYQLALFDVPPKLIAYYTAVASKMAQTLNINSRNRYVFLITPDIKRDIYVESITENTDIGSEINILVIHINERNIYNITETTKCIAHEIAHHVGQDTELRRKRAAYFAKCYIALLLIRSLDYKLFPREYGIYQIFTSLENIVDKIYKLAYDFALEEILNDKEKFYYMDRLQDNIHFALIQLLNKIGKIDKNLYEIMEQNLSSEIIQKYAKKSELSFVNLDTSNVDDNPILGNYICRMILENTYENLSDYIYNSEILKKDVMSIRFIFKEGYADIQMLQLTQNPKSDGKEVVSDYTDSLKNAIGRLDEIMRKCAVINAFLGTEDYKELWNPNVPQSEHNWYKAYLTFVCKQASSYFSEVKSQVAFTQPDRTFDCSKTSLFKSSNMSDIIDYMDSTIASYTENILESKKPNFFVKR